MNSIFPSNANEELNSNNIIIVSEDQSEWSEEFDVDTKNVMPIRVIGNVMGTLIQPDSNESTNLNSKNIMIVSEDSSEWSQEFMAVEENEGTMNASNETDSALTEDNTEMHNTEENNANVNDDATQGSTGTSYSRSDIEDTQQVNVQKPSPEMLMETEILRCRTCLNIVDLEDNVPLYTAQTSGETLKDLLIYLLPQMATTLCDEDIVCTQCDNSIKFCVEFIDNCLKVETELVNEVEAAENDRENETLNVDDNVDDKRRVTLDHDYMVGEANAKIKIEMDADDSEPNDSFLGEGDPILGSMDGYLFECLSCGLTFESETFLDNHSRSVHGITKSVTQESRERIYYKCSPCEVLFPTHRLYNDHVRKSHPEATVESPKMNSYTCKQCGKAFFCLGELFKHKAKAHAFPCYVCPERFNRKKDLDDHLATHPDLYFCEICNEGFKTRKLFSGHVMSHDDPSLNLCEECGRNFSTPEELALHMEQSDHPVERLLRKFVCETCDAAFTDRKRLNKHKKAYHECVREYLCTICDKNFSSKTSLDSHYRLKHAEVKPYQCERCGDRFARLDYLRRHNNCNEADQCKKFLKGPRRKFRYTKADGEPIKCKLCGKVFKDVYLLKLHLTTHTNLRRFRCSICNLTFTTNKNRERHEKIHADPLSKYRCTVCWKRTQSQVELDEHMTTHEKKYQCHVCHESFARVYLLNYHVSEVHADDEDVEKEKQIVFTEGLKEYLLEY